MPATSPPAERRPGRRTDAQGRPSRHQASPARGGASWWRRWWDRLRRALRFRASLAGTVISALMAITAVGLLFSGLVTYSLYSRSIEERIDRDLAQEVEELRTLATDVDPQTGESFSSVEDLLYAALQRNVPDRSEEFMATIDGEVPFVSAAPRPMHLDEKDELIGFLDGIPAGSSPRYTTITDFRGHEVRVVAVPVQVPGDPAHGIFVAAIDATAERASLTNALWAQVLAGLLTLLLIAVVGTLVFRGLLRPVRELITAVERIDDYHLTERVPEQGTQDLVVLSHTFNKMLDRLDSSATAQRALLDDVGHELRTPLTIIRGHLEILDTDDIEDVTATRELVLDEVDRMGRLVDELVLLAKSERADFLQCGPVEIDEVVDGVFERARALADRQFRIDSACGAVIYADRQRLTQALVQLLSNAIRHTGVDDQIAFGARLHPCEDSVEVWVRDTGTGIDPKNHERVFERFERGDHTGGNVSSGLGLSIVSAIARAHGGRVDLTSAPGRGSTFTLVIPNPTGREGERP